MALASGIRRAAAAAAVAAAMAVAASAAGVTPAGAAQAGLTVAVDTVAVGSPRTGVVAEGTYSCGPFASGAPDRGVVDMTVQQVRAGATATAYGYLEPTVCDGTPQAFTISLTGTSDRRFRAGTAVWSVSGYVEGDTGLQHTYVPPTAITVTR
jgi:hypothetical protein